MATKVFISWSGPLTQKIAEELDSWIPKVLQSVDAYYTPKDIEKGRRWAGEIDNELSQSELGILCLTQENQSSPWIAFEAGALSKHKDVSRVCPLLFNFDNAELTGPLSMLQTTKFEKDEFKKLISSINDCSEKPLDEKTFDETFEVWWPQLEKKIRQILSEKDAMTKPQKRDPQDILEEILELVRSSNYFPLKQEYRETIVEIVDSLIILKDKVVRNNSYAYPELQSLMYGIRRLCYDTGNPELYDRINLYSNRSEYYLGRMEKKARLAFSEATEKNPKNIERDNKLE